MSKRLFSVDRNNNKPQQPLLTRDKAEQMCQKKLREVRKVKSKLYQTVLVRNTLRYVQTSTRSIFSSQPDEYYVPFSKKSCIELTADDIDNILCDIRFQPAHISDITFQAELPEKRLASFDKKDVESWKNMFSVSVDDSVVPDNDISEDLSDEDYIDELLRNRNNCTITKFTIDNRQIPFHSIWDSPIF